MKTGLVIPLSLPVSGLDEIVVEQFLEAYIGLGLANEEEVGAAAEDEVAEGLAADQVVAEEDRAEGSQLLDMHGDPALGGDGSEVLLADCRVLPCSPGSSWSWMNSGARSNAMLWPTAIKGTSSMGWKYWVLGLELGAGLRGGAGRALDLARGVDFGCRPGPRGCARRGAGRG